MKKYFMTAMIILVCVNLLACNSSKEDSLFESMSAYEGYMRVVSQEEYDFYKYFVERDLPKEITKEELDEKVQAYINQVNAVFYLGNKLGFCEPYSFELIQIRMTQENDNRKIKLEQGEVVYGLEQFDLGTYFQYELSNLEIDIQAYILENCDAEIQKEAEAYYNVNKEHFTVREQVEYEVTIGTETETMLADRTQLDFFGEADAGLADFLEIAEAGDTYEDVQNGQQRSVIVTDVQYQEITFKENEMSVIENYIEAELYPALIEKIAQNNPVEFE